MIYVKGYGLYFLSREERSKSEIQMIRDLNRFPFANNDLMKGVSQTNNKYTWKSEYALFFFSIGELTILRPKRSPNRGLPKKIV